MKQEPEFHAAQADLRGFRYALEPLRQKREWELDLLQREVASLAVRVEAAYATLADLHARRMAAAESAARACLERVDPVAHRQSLAYLAQLQGRVVEARRERDALAAEKTEAMARCIAGQQKLELLARNREDALRDYAAEQSIRLAAEADGDWIMRCHWRAATSNVEATE